MKLIIDIPEEEYKRMTKESIYSTHVMICAIQNGTPLDDVKAEIREKSVWYRGQTYDGLCIALKIIDKYIGKADIKTNRKNCEYRHENGNCLKVGGFCTSVDDEHCAKTLEILDNIGKGSRGEC